MLITIGEHWAQVERHDSESDLQTHLSRGKQHVLVLGQGCTDPTQFYSVTMTLFPGSVEPKINAIGVYIDDLGCVPHLAVLHDEPLMFLGLNREVVVLEALGLRVRSRTDCGGPLLGLVAVPESGRVLAISETDLVGLDPQGQVVWHYPAADLITAWRFERDIITLEHMEEPSSVLAIGAGTRV